MNKQREEDDDRISDLLMLAMRGEEKDFITTLLDQSDLIKLDIGTPFGTWLHQVCKRGFINAARVLVEQGVPASFVPTGMEYDALIPSVQSGNLELVEFIISAGASYNYTGGSMCNALFVAIENGHKEIARFLIENGFDTSVVYQGNMDAAAYAKYMKKPEMLDLFDSPASPGFNALSDLPTFSGKMTHEKIQAIESVLKRSIPSFLADFLLSSFPDELYFSTSPDDNTWEWLADDHLLFHTVRSYVAYNLDDISNENLTPYFPGHLIIGTNGGGDYWCVPTSSGAEEAVFVFDHESESFAESGLSFPEFTAQLIAGLREFEADLQSRG